MGLKAVFQKGADTAFRVFKEAVKSGQYVKITDDGFEKTEALTPISAIITVFKQEDIEKLSFADKVQPTDLQCLVRGSELSGIKVNTSDEIRITDPETSEVTAYSIIGFDTDPYEALFTVGLRNA